MKNLQYNFMTTKNIKPSGWLLKQLKIQAKGLCGNLDKVWPDIKDSAWIGGDREGWERVPYWLDGFVPLAYLLEDDDMIRRARLYIDAIIKRQNEDGWICPCGREERANYDTWATLLILKVLTVYADCSGDERIPEVVEKCLRQFDVHINFNTLRTWGAARWFEGIIPIFWLYERTHDEWLITLAKKLRVQGFDWKGLFETGFIDEFAADKRYDLFSHIVNVAMMLKSEALTSLISGGNPDEFAETALKYLFEKHGTAAEHFNGDENLSGTSPIHGTELCGVVETMYSYEWLFAIGGNPKWLDRLERLAFNSLPAAISPDMWSHQYDQMANQVASFPMSKQPFHSNNNVAHTFGLEPNFGCCTANFGQGFPKLALSAFMRSDDVLASCVLVPSAAETEINGVSVKCELETGYPFRDNLTYRVTTEKPVEFTLSVRIPSFADSAEVDGKAVDVGQFAEIRRTWCGTETVNVRLSFKTRITERPGDMVCVWRGPLLYSVAVGEKWERVEYWQNGVDRKFPYCDYYIYPTSKWNYALADDKFEVRENPFESGFGNAEPPIEMTAEMCEIDWDFNNGHCDEQPRSRKPLGETERVRLIPYGCSNLRLTEFPYLKQNPKPHEKI